MCTSLDVSVIFVIFYISRSSGLLTSEDELGLDKLKLKQAFDKLLYELVDLNQERLNAINKVFQLDEHPKTAGLRSSAEEKDENPLVLFIVNRDNTKNEDNDSRDVFDLLYDYLRSRAESAESRGLGVPDSDDDGIGEKAAEEKAVLRAWKSCKKSAINSCNKACVAAFKNVCSDYKCSIRMKKAFRRECKETCTSRFQY